MVYVAYFQELGQVFGQTQVVASESEGLEFLAQFENQEGWQGVQSFDSEDSAQDFIDYQEGNNQ